ncbi:FkbM family methyltransferase [Bradyrhizobium sp. 62]|uniref:FkbM family methyltransferase n=1 Tax=Bradyrhizobium sp. 62 TaxID=1043588 RepID=UPI001FF9EF89
MKFDFTDRLCTFLFGRLAAVKSEKLFFVQVGANDGFSGDPVNNLAKRHNWSGLVIEPVPDLFSELSLNYSDFPKIECLQLACGERREERPFYRIRYRDGKPIYSNKGLSSFHREIIRGHFSSDADFEESVERVQVGVVPLNDLLEERAIEKVDLLIVDTEGADQEVLAGFDLSIYAPDLVMMEHYHLDKISRNGLAQRMHEDGYRRIVGAMDTFFVKPHLFSDIEMEMLGAFHAPILAWRWEDNHFDKA